MRLHSCYSGLKRNLSFTYSILDFDWSIYVQKTACKYRSATNNWCKYLDAIKHAHFENASSASIKKFRSFFPNVDMARLVELSKSEKYVKINHTFYL